MYQIIMRSLTAFIIICVLLVRPAAAEVCTATTVIPIGDSITAGASSGIADPALWVGYRKTLYDGLIGSGRLVDFVGGEVDGWSVVNFDSRHEGHGGWTSANIALNAYQWLVNNPANYVLLHIGTNEPSTDVTNVGLILDEIDRYEVDYGVTVTVIVAQIVQSYAFDAIDPVITTYNQNLATLVSQRISTGDDLVLVDMENALTYPDDLYDSLHPNPTGYAKMAAVWRIALEAAIGPCTVPDTTSPTEPTGFTAAVVGTDRIDLSWNPSTDTGGTGWVGYRVYRDGIEVATTSLLTYSDTGLSPGTIYNYTLEAYDNTGNVVLSTPVSATTVALNASVIRMNMGGGAYTDSNGNVWSADYGSNTGYAASTGAAISATADPVLFQTLRWDDSPAPELAYRFSVADGVYQVSLYLSETFLNGAGQRVFDVRMEGAQVFNDVDIYAEAGGRDTALVKTALVTVLDGELLVEFVHQLENPAVSAIEAIRIGDAVPDTSSPSQPTGLTGTAVSANQINLNWLASTDTGGSGLAGYRVYRDGIQIGITTLTSYSDTGLTAGTTYSYTVEAYDNAGNVSLLSAAASLTTLAQGTAIRVNAGGGAYTDSNGNTWLADFGFNTGNAASTSALVSGTADPVLFQTLRWDSATTPELSYRFPVTDGVYQVNLYLAETFVAGAGQRIFDVRMEGTQVLNDVDIYAESGGSNTTLIKTVLVTVLDGELHMEFIHQVENPVVSAIEAIRIGDVVPDTTAPSQPGSLMGTAVGANQVDLSWLASTDTGGSGLAGYRIYRDGIQVGSTSLLTYSDTGLTAGTAYSYTVEAYDNAGNISLLSAAVSVTTLLPDSTAPSQPTGLTGIVVSDSQINLSWLASTDTGGSGLAGYRIYRDGIQVGSTSLLTYSDTGLLPVTAYSYTVEAYDNAGNVSPLSAAVSLTTLIQGATTRVNAGGGAYTDSNGNVWSADFGFDTGVVASVGSAISGTLDEALFQSLRWDAGTAPELSYRFAVADGVYQVSLYLAESFVTGAGQRMFDVRMEGALVFNGVDIYAEVGRDTALVKTALVTVLDGELSIVFEHQVENPVINAIEAIRIGDAVPDTTPPSQPGGLAGTAVGASQVNLSWLASTDTGGSGLAGYRVYRDGVQVGITSLLSYSDTGLTAVTAYSYTVEAYDNTGNVSPLSAAVSVTTLTQDTAIRVNAGGGAFTDFYGNVWSADFGFDTGVVASVGSAISGTLDEALFQAMRWDAGTAPELGYRFPVANGVYQVNLYLAETFVTGAGQRIFDVRMEGALVFNGVDIYAEAGGADTALVRTAQVTVLDGELNIVFEHLVENPVVNAIEIIAQ